MGKTCNKPYGFCIKFNLEEAIKTLKDWWGSDLEIEIDTFRRKNTLIFAIDDDSYYKNGEWKFSGNRIVVKSSKEYMTKAFAKFIEDYDGMIVTLEDAIEFVKDFYYGSL